MNYTLQKQQQRLNTFIKKCEKNIEQAIKSLNTANNAPSSISKSLHKHSTYVLTTQVTVCRQTHNNKTFGNLQFFFKSRLHHASTFCHSAVMFIAHNQQSWRILRNSSIDKYLIQQSAAIPHLQSFYTAAVAAATPPPPPTTTIIAFVFFVYRPIFGCHSRLGPVSESLPKNL